MVSSVQRTSLARSMGLQKQRIGLTRKYTLLFGRRTALLAQRRERDRIAASEGYCRRQNKIRHNL